MDLDAPRASLRRALLAHTPADEEEAAHRQSILSLVEGEPACFARSTYAPGHVTGSAFILSRVGRDGGVRVLLHHHRRLDRWLQMGGHDEGESDPFRTAMREGREESGLTDLEPLSAEILDVEVHPIPAAKGEPAHHHFDVRYAFRTLRPEAIQKDAAESHALEWVPLEEAVGRMGEGGAARVVARLERIRLV